MITGTADPGMPRRGTPAFDGADPALLRAGRAAWGDGFHIRVAARTGTTQDLAAQAARAGARAGWCAVAEEQTAGRGRLGRRWEAPPGSALLTSIVLRVTGPVGWVPLAAGLAVVDALAEAAHLEARLKWPNDVQAGGGKLAGILAELEQRGSDVPAVVLGIGLNVSVDAFPQGATGASLHTLLAPQPPPSRESLLAALLGTLRRRCDLVDGGAEGIEELRADWEAAAIGLGRPVSVTAPGGTVRGIALGLAPSGALRVRRDDGTEVAVLAGDALPG
jgi:BirA family transcriptional regulator, biotin operon repressor / biotin---[acetyl-CoA-carboxylase] ligase